MVSGHRDRRLDYIAAAGARAQQNIVFFPAFPLIVRAVARCRNTPRPTLSAGRSRQSSCSVGARAALQIAREHLTEEQSWTALWLLAAYPFALFFGASKPSRGPARVPRHVLPVRATPLRSRRDVGPTAGLTRPNGLFLCVPLA